MRHGFPALSLCSGELQRSSLTGGYEKDFQTQRLLPRIDFGSACRQMILHKFDIMQVQLDIGFDQLLKIVKNLSSRQLKQLKAEIEKETTEAGKVDLESLLLNGPTATKKQLDIINQNRKAINQWRTN
jgi:hypothetical protein